MKTISNWHDLRPYGIDILTGEACGLSYRFLCDLTAKGKRIVEKCLGLQGLAAENWNAGSKDDPHVASIMLAPPMFAPIAMFALLETGCTEVWLYQNNAVLGVEPGDDPAQVALAEKLAQEAIVRKFAYHGTAGSRNLHLMTGRIE